MGDFCYSQRIYDERLSSLSKHNPFLLFPHTPDSVILLSEALFCDSRPFLRLKLSRGTTISAVISQAVVDLKLEIN